MTGPDELGSSEVGRDPFAGSVALRADGLLAAFGEAGLLVGADIHVAKAVGRLGEENDDRVLLALALCARAVRRGSICIDLGQQPKVDPGLPWPDADGWPAAVLGSPLTGEPNGGSTTRPLVWDRELLYLNRYWQQERQLTADLLRRLGASPPVVEAARLEAALDRLFPPSAEEETGGPDQQRLAAATAVRSLTTLMVGGPGTGKTATVARILALLADQPGPVPRIALAAPTGKAAARLTEAVAIEFAALAGVGGGAGGRGGDGGAGGGGGGDGGGEPPTAMTVHRLLGALPDNNSRFVHHRGRQLPYDVIVVDEASMVSLTLLARLMEAVPDRARLILVGDPGQLASVEAGAVLADLVTGLADRPEVVTLTRNYRFGGPIAALADAVRSGDATEALALLAGGSAEITLTETGSPALWGNSWLELQQAAAAGDAAAALAAMSGHRVLCAHRHGSFGVDTWNSLMTHWLTRTLGLPAQQQWYPGRPLLITENDYALGLFNGDTGVVVQDADDLPVAVFGNAAAPVRYRPGRLAQVETAYAMTVHRSQGSQFNQVTLVLPTVESPLLTRELLYTAITRARSGVRIIGTEAAFRAAVGRTAVRASGIPGRLLAAMPGE